MISYYVLGTLVAKVFGLTSTNSIIIIMGLYLLILIIGTILAISKKDLVRSLGYLFITFFIILFIDFFIITMMLQY